MQQPLKRVASKRLKVGRFQAQAGLPDGLFANQKSQFGQVFEGLRLEMLIYFIAIWIFYRHL
jgi:hypothetical protein